MPKKACCCKTNCCDPLFYSNFIILIKDKNIGKRDSITLIRRSIYYYNNREKSDINNLKNYIDITFLNNIFKLYEK